MKITERYRTLCKKLFKSNFSNRKPRIGDFWALENKPDWVLLITNVWENKPNFIEFISYDNQLKKIKDFGLPQELNYVDDPQNTIYLLFNESDCLDALAVCKNLYDQDIIEELLNFIQKERSR